MKHIQEYCKTMKMKFVEENEFGFIASIKSPIKAAKKHSSKFQTVGYKLDYYQMLVLTDGDIQFGKRIKRSLVR